MTPYAAGMLTHVGLRMLGAAALFVTLGCFSDSDGGSGGSGNDGSGDGDGDGTDDDSGPGTTTSDPGTGSGSGSGSGTSEGSDSETGEGTTADDPTGADECDPDQTCVGIPPPEWSGPVVLYEGPSADPIPPCPGLYPAASAEGNVGLGADPAECGGCQCGDPTDVECAGPTMRLYFSSECGLGIDDEVRLLGHDECLPLTTDVGGSINSDPIVPIAGTGRCEPSGGTTNVPEPGWTSAARACGGASSPSVCGDDGMCMPTVGEPYDSGLCIWREGDSGCPGGSYTVKHLLFEGVQDTRGCSACTCNAPAGAACDGIVQVHRNSGCTNLQATLNEPGSECVSVRGTENDPPLSVKMTVFGTTGGMCVPGGGRAEGEATPTEPITVCCQG